MGKIMSKIMSKMHSNDFFVLKSFGSDLTAEFFLKNISENEYF